MAKVNRICTVHDFKNVTVQQNSSQQKIKTLIFHITLKLLKNKARFKHNVYNLQSKVSGVSIFPTN